MMGRFPFCLKLGGIKLLGFTPSALYHTSSSLPCRTTSSANFLPLTCTSNPISTLRRRIWPDSKLHHQGITAFSSSSRAIGEKSGTGCATSSDNPGGVHDVGFLDLSDEQLMSQCEMGTFKASGPGGQHRNKRETAVRLKHLPTGIIAQASEDRSQHKNRASALARLRALLALKGVGVDMVNNMTINSGYLGASKKTCGSQCLFSSNGASPNSSSKVQHQRIRMWPTN